MSRPTAMARHWPRSRVYYFVLDRPNVVYLQVASYGSFFRKFTLSVIARAFGVPVVTHIHGAQFHVVYANSPKVVQKRSGICSGTPAPSLLSETPGRSV